MPTRAELEDIRAAVYADDIEIPDGAKQWSVSQAEDFFASGGDQWPTFIANDAPPVDADDVPPVDADTRNRNAWALALGACLPNAPIPNIGLPHQHNDGVPAEENVLGDAATEGAGRIFCVSDLHTDHAANMDWCRALSAGGFERDVLIVAGDVTSSHVLLEETLTLLVRAFKHVFFVPGNHDVWVKGVPSGGLHVRAEKIDSTGRLKEILQLCGRLGVHTQPAFACGAIVAPILSWYHASWDQEPDVVGWDGIPPASLVMSDFHRCTWPVSLSTEDDSIAARLDAMNDEDKDGTVLHAFACLPHVAHGAAKQGTLEEKVAGLRAAHPAAPLITASHFVPHAELCPEKRFLFFPPLAKACGSDYLARRIAALRPKVHCFGHTHLGWDMTLDDGVRYLQAPLAYPDERRQRLGTVACGTDFPYGSRGGVANTPVLVYDAIERRYPPKYDAGWSNFYAKYPRRPDLCHLLAPRTTRRWERQTGGGGAVGFFEAGDQTRVTPPWKLGPANAVRSEDNQQERFD